MSTSEKRLQAYISGQVQGVNFRATTQSTAERLGIKGSVRNLLDGRVEVIAEGPESSLHDLIAFLHQGPPAAQVSGVDVAWQDATGEYPGFSIRPTT